MTEELKQAVIKALQKNHKNGPINAKNLAGIFHNIIDENQTLAADKIAALINEADMKSENEEEDDDE